MGRDDSMSEADRDVHQQAIASLFQVFESLCEGAVAVDRQARIVWMSERYRALLGLSSQDTVLGRPVEEVIPQSLMRQVVETNRPILLDLMQFAEQWLVVTRLPLRDEAGVVTGAIGFVLYDRVDYLRPLVAKVSALQAELQEAQRQLARQRGPRYSLSQFIGRSPAVQAVKTLARKAARLDSTVLLLGETGTGKELLAHGIHGASPRADRPLVSVNTAAVPESLLEAEFFGTAPGAYTGADRRGREGKVVLANGGTLFLDEIGDMPLPLQAKLLRVLQESEVEALGSNRVQRVDVRVIAATSQDLQQLVAAGRFRADLYFRLNVLPITLPPLRERLEDLELLCEVLLEQVALQAGLPQYGLHSDALALLARHAWPGNIRELRNVLERTLILAEGSSIKAADLATILPDLPVAPSPQPRRLAEVVAAAERQALAQALEACAGNKLRAARMLGISRATLYDRLNSFPELQG